MAVRATLLEIHNTYKLPIALLYGQEGLGCMYAISAIEYSNQPTEESTIKRSPVHGEGHAVAALTAYTVNRSVKVKVLDFVKRGGPKLTVGRTIFELWLGL